MRARIQKFPKDRSGSSVYRIFNNSGAFIDVMDTGCTILCVNVHERSGALRNVLTAPCHIRIGGRWSAAPDSRVWRGAETADGGVEFRGEGRDGDCVLTMGVKFRYKDSERLVIDYTWQTSEERDVYLTHRLPFSLDGLQSPESLTIRAFAPRRPDAAGQDAPATPSPTSAMEYLPLSRGLQTYLAGGPVIHPFTELASRSTELALTAYSTMPVMALQPESDSPGSVWFEARKLPAVSNSTRQERTVYGVDLLYRPEDGPSANPFLFFGK